MLYPIGAYSQLLFDRESGGEYTVESLTVSGDLITPATRALNVDGDGLPIDSGYGIWPAATNLITNGGFETNTTGWSTTSPGAWIASGGTLTRITSDAKFGDAAARIVVTNQQFRGAAFAVTLSPTTTYTVSFWYKGTQVNGAALFLGEAGSSTGQSTALSNAADWTRASATFTTTAGTSYVVGIRTTGSNGSMDIVFDGVQVETGSIATPYIETDGSTESRTAGRIQMPVADLFTETQGAVFARLNAGAASTALAGFPRVYQLRDDGNNRIDNAYDASSARWGFSRKAAAAGLDVFITDAFAGGAGLSLLSAWTATQLRGSLDGGAFSSVANSSIPTLTATTIDIGSNAGASSWWGGNVRWFATFAGTLTDADAAALDALGDTPPTWAQLVGALPATAQVTGLWDARTAQFFKAAA